MIDRRGQSSENNITPLLINYNPFLKKKTKLQNSHLRYSVDVVEIKIVT